METHNRDLGTAMEVEPDGAVRVKRVTRESDIELKLDPNRWEAAETETGLAFFDHMLEMLAWHAPTRTATPSPPGPRRWRTWRCGSTTAACR